MAKKKDQKTKAQLQEEYNDLIERRDEIIERRDKLTKDEYKQTYDTILKTRDTLSDMQAKTAKEQLKKSQTAETQEALYNTYITNTEDRIVKLRAAEVELKLQLAGRIVNNIYVLLKDNKKLSKEMKDFVGNIEKIQDKNQKKVIFTDDHQLRQMLSQMPKFTLDKTPESSLIIKLSEAFKHLTKDDVNLYSTDITRAKDQLNLFTKLVEQGKLYKETPTFSEIADIEKNRSKVSEYEKQIKEYQTKIQEIQNDAQVFNNKMIEKLDTLKERAQKNAEEILAHQDFQKGIIEKLEALNQEIDAHPANSKNKRTKLQTVKAAVQKVGDKVQRLTNKVKSKAHELGVTVKSTVSQARDTIADTAVGRGMSSLKDEIMLDQGKPRNWKATIENQKNKLVRKIRGRGWE